MQELQPPSLDAPIDCFTPVHAAGVQPGARALDAQRSVRYDALLELIDQLQRKRSIIELARVAAARWKHCASVDHWRLLCVYGQHAVLVVAEGNQTEVSELALGALEPYDAELWRKRAPRHLDAVTLAHERSRLPRELATPEGQACSVWPVQQGTLSLGMLSVLSKHKAFDAMDRKFIQLVAAALATRIVAILTEQTLQAELLEAERRAQAQRQAGILGRLVNGVAHEFNTPLGVQISACDALSDLLRESAGQGGQDEDVHETLDLIAQQARRAAHIVKRLKQISAAAQANPKVQTDLLEEMQMMASKHTDLDIAIECAEGLHLAMDRVALATVLDELLDNVRAHAGQAGGSPRVRLRLERGAGEMRIAVIDQGPGLDARQAASLFEPFRTSKQSAGHMGIGGYIAHNVATEALGARLELSTAPGRTSVTLCLPLAGA